MARGFIFLTFPSGNLMLVEKVLAEWSRARTDSLPTIGRELYPIPKGVFAQVSRKLE